MIELRLIREHYADIEARLRTRDSSVNLSEILSLDERRRELISDVERLKAERNQGSQEVGRRKRDGWWQRSCAGGAGPLCWSRRS